MTFFFANKQRRKAFTLVELVITMALFLVVAALVMAYVVFMNGFTERNAGASALNRQIASVRQSLDEWFSYFDDADYTIELPETHEDGELHILAIARQGVQAYPVYMELSLMPDEASSELSTQQTLQLCYPVGAGRGEETQSDVLGSAAQYDLVSVACPNVYGITLGEYTEDWTYDPDEEPEILFPQDDTSELNTIRFSIHQRVRGALYSCIISYL